MTLVKLTLMEQINLKNDSRVFLNSPLVEDI